MMHPILAFNPVTKHLDVIESVHINGGSIQMDIEEYEVAKKIIQFIFSNIRVFVVF